ncbi:putative retrotransposon hot spot (RHS) protein [Trypanosoma cruzi]|nr:putative retrotransposon hot spot (RHS) protein [Trypanosoma cruzi]
MAAAVGLCDCALAMRVSSFAAAPSLCWWGRRRATASLELRPSGRGKAPTAADGDGLCCRRCDGRTSPVSQSTEMDEGRTASPAPLIILSVHCSHTPHAPQSSVATTIRMSVSQLECKIDVDPFSPCLSAAVLLYVSFVVYVGRACCRCLLCNADSRERETML